MADIGIVIILCGIVLIGSLGTSIKALSEVHDLRNTGVGVTGPAGAPGTSSNTGATGPPGAAGPTGPQGAAGTSSNTGATGPQGTVGSTGPQGLAGATGPQGSASNTGATGPQGTVGPTGPQGTVSNTGATGPQGPAGTTGPTGPSSSGVTGPTGPTSSGVTGPTGFGLSGTGTLLNQPFLFHPVSSQNGGSTGTVTNTFTSNFVGASIAPGSTDTSGYVTITNGVFSSGSIVQDTFTITFNSPFNTSNLPRAVSIAFTSQAVDGLLNTNEAFMIIGGDLLSATQFQVIIRISVGGSAVNSGPISLFSYIVL